MRRATLVLAFASLVACGTQPLAGADAGDPTLDAGGLDAGGNDAGQSNDAGALPDAGHQDTDAGATDAGTGDAGTNDAGTTDGGVLTGHLVGGSGPTPGAIGGVHFVAGTLSGDTDATGAFQYPSGGQITFSVSDITFRPVAGAPLLTPWQLVGTGTCTMGSELERLLVLLDSLDTDNDPATGVHFSPFPTVLPARALSGLTLIDVQTRVGELTNGRSAISVATAIDRFIRQVDDEGWSQIAVDTFTGLTAAHRGQGMATDGTHWFFSSTVGVADLERTDLNYSSQQLNSGAIPLALYLSDGSNHIGDIDYYAGNLYAPIEDGSAYQHPKVALYDATTLDIGTVVSIPQSLQTQGVPWVAVDAARSYVYLAEWNPTTQLNRFSLSTISYLDSLPLVAPAGVTLSRFQGAKVFEGALYASADDATKSVYKVNLETGTVLRLFNIATTSEVEGIAFLLRPDGSELHTQNVSSSSTGLDVRHHQRVRLPLRKQVCP